MRTIRKYPLLIKDEQEIVMPSDAVVLHIALQAEAPFLWAVIGVSKIDGRPLKPTKDHRFAIHGTGHFIPEDREYISTFLQGSFVWHVFKIVT